MDVNVDAWEAKKKEERNKNDAHILQVFICPNKANDTKKNKNKNLDVNKRTLIDTVCYFYCPYLLFNNVQILTLIYDII